jgi:hypothetical protein
LAIDDMIVKNILFLYNWLVLWNKDWKSIPDEQKKHAFHKSMPQALWIWKDATAYMHKKNQYTPYVDLDVHALAQKGHSVVLEFVRKCCVAIVNLYVIWAFFSFFFWLMLSVILLLGM